MIRKETIVLTLAMLLGLNCSGSASKDSKDGMALAVLGLASSARTGSATLEIVEKISFPFVTPYAIAVDSNDYLYVSDGCFFRDANGFSPYALDTFSLYLYNSSKYADCGIPSYRILKFDSNSQYIG